MLEIENINVRYGPIHALKNISISVGESEIVTVVGSNGAGKSSLLRAIAGLKQGFSTAVIVGEFNDLSTQKLADKSRSVLEPDEAIIIVSPSLEIPEMIDPNLLESPFALNGKATAYICLETSSRGPVQDPNDLMKWRR